MDSWMWLMIAAAALVYPVCYTLGWAWSRGYHRGKREFVDQLVKDSCRGEGVDG